jgi:hypothetical protein
VHLHAKPFSQARKLKNPTNHATNVGGRCTIQISPLMLFYCFMLHLLVNAGIIIVLFVNKLSLVKLVPKKRILINKRRIKKLEPMLDGQIFLSNWIVGSF